MKHTLNKKKMELSVQQQGVVRQSIKLAKKMDSGLYENYIDAKIYMTEMEKSVVSNAISNPTQIIIPDDSDAETTIKWYVSTYTQLTQILNTMYDEKAMLRKTKPNIIRRIINKLCNK